MRIAIPGLLGLVACTPIYDAQFNDRAAELEEFRSEFRPAGNANKMLASGGDRVFWVDQRSPGNTLYLYSSLPGQQMEEELRYDWSEGKGSFEDYRFSQDLIIDCGAGNAYRHSDTAELNPFAHTSFAFENCTLDRQTAYFLVGQGAFRRWTPPTPIPDVNPMDQQGDTFIDFEMDSKIFGSIGGYAVLGNTAVVTDGTGDLFVVDLTTFAAKWLMNNEPANGRVLFDTTGVLYETSNGARYITFTADADPPDEAFNDMVSDGGYHLNFKHGDIQQPASNGEYTLHGRHIIYRGERGIFAYGLDTRSVVDLLLDRGDGIDLELAYHQPVIANTNQLFVFGNDDFGVNFTGAIFQVDLADRLR